ncbi:MAG: family 16 glycosylhydrolase [Rhodothermales bacterium]
MMKLLGMFFLGMLFAGVPHAAAQQWELVWSDEFEGDGLVDASLWEYQVGASGWGNRELQFYTEERLENVRRESGRLVIEARREDYEGAAYTSGRIRTRGKGDWLYGRIEVRAKLPAGLGTWPAIWMLATDSDHGDGGWPDMGEIDIMEAVGHDPGRTHSAIHTNALNHSLGTNPFATRAVPTSTTEFHDYAMEWTPKRITTFVDGVPNLVFDRNGADWRRWPFDRPFHLILNIAVGGTWGGAQGVDPTAFPTRMEIEYVRVYEDLAGPPEVGLFGLTDPAVVPAGGTLDLNATATDPASTIENLTILQGDGVLAEAQAGAVAVSLDNLHPGCYEVRAVAEDADGWTGESARIPVQVGDACGQAPYLMRAHPVPGRVQAEYYDLGGPGVGYSDISSINTGGTIRMSEGVDIGLSGDVGGGHAIQDVTRREWVAYTVHAAEAGSYRLSARLSAMSAGTLDIHVNGASTAEPLSFQATNSETLFRTAVLDSVWLEAGTNRIRIGFTGLGVRLNWFELVAATSTSVESSTGALPDGGPWLESVYPNPFGRTLHVVMSGRTAGTLRAELFDTLGRSVWAAAADIDRQTVKMDIPALPAGAYVLRLEMGGVIRDQVIVGGINPAS